MYPMIVVITIAPPITPPTIPPIAPLDRDVNCISEGAVVVVDAVVDEVDWVVLCDTVSDAEVGLFVNTSVGTDTLKISLWEMTLAGYMRGKALAVPSMKIVSDCFLETSGSSPSTVSPHVGKPPRVPICYLRLRSLGRTSPVPCYHQQVEGVIRSAFYDDRIHTLSSGQWIQPAVTSWPDSSVFASKLAVKMPIFG